MANTQLMKLEPSCCERGVNQGELCTYCYADNIAFAAQFDERTTVKRPFMRSAPCAVLCRGDGDQVLALIGPNIQEGCAGFGDTLADARRALADEIEKEVTV